MSILTPTDVQTVQSLLNNMSVALTEVLKMTEAVKEQLTALSDHNISKSSHSDIRTDIVCVQEEVTSLMPTLHEGGIYTGPAVMTIGEDGDITNLGFIDPTVIATTPETPPDTSVAP